MAQLPARSVAAWTAPFIAPKQGRWATRCGSEFAMLDAAAAVRRERSCVSQHGRVWPWKGVVAHLDDAVRLGREA